jgi:hypothetical protein
LLDLTNLSDRIDLADLTDLADLADLSDLNAMVCLVWHRILLERVTLLKRAKSIAVISGKISLFEAWRI